MKLIKIILAAVVAIIVAWLVAELIVLFIEGIFWIAFAILMLLIAIPVYNYVKGKML